jgi:RNA polymerase sigma-70 factor, ECF subfamily
MVEPAKAVKSAARSRLMERAQAGDKEAFDDLFADIGPLITRSVRRRVFDPAEVDDICQEILLAIFKSRHTYQPSRPFEPWLHAIVRHVISAHLHEHRRRTAWNEPMSDSMDISSDDDSGLISTLNDGLGQLSTNQLEALNLTKIMGLSIEEAAERAGTSAGSIKVRVHRAYESLKKSILR